MSSRVHRRFLLLSVAAGIAAPSGAQGPPNVVLILADDLGYGDLRSYHEASKAPTPHLDRLAREGLRFTDAHSPSSVCTPTRYGLLTGRYAWRTPLKKSVLWPWDPPLIEDERVTLPELLRAAGYRTACVGKWHLGWDWPLMGASEGEPARHVSDELDGITWPSARRAEIAARVDWDRPVRGGPLAHGFEHYFGDDVPNFPPYAFLEDERVTARPSAEKPAGLFGHAGPLVPGWELNAVMPRLEEHACAWIDAHAASDDERLFFLYVPLTAPHTPIAPAPRFADCSEAGAYGDFVCQVDAFVGALLAALERNGLEHDTLVVFTSDNGSPARDGTGMSGAVGSVRERFGHDPSGGWRGLKSDAWEGGHRVPLIVRWPGRVAPDSTNDAPVCLTDWYRTLAGIAGARVPADAAEDGFDLRAELFGEPAGLPARDHLVHHSGQGVFAIRVGRWKLVLGRSSGGFTRWTPPADAPAGQLYDLVEDPGEQVNLYTSEPEVVARLSERLDELRSSGRSSPLD